MPLIFFFLKNILGPFQENTKIKIKTKNRNIPNSTMLNTMQKELNLYLLQLSRNYGSKTARNPDFGQNPTK